MTLASDFFIIRPMSKTEPSSAYRDGLIARVKAARNATGMSQVEMATALGMAQGTYKQYETRSSLPHEYIERFCAIARISERWLISGRGQGPIARPGNLAETG